MSKKLHQLFLEKANLWPSLWDFFRLALPAIDRLEANTSPTLFIMPVASVPPAGFTSQMITLTLFTPQTKNSFVFFFFPWEVIRSVLKVLLTTLTPYRGIVCSGEGSVVWSDRCVLRAQSEFQRATLRGFGENTAFKQPAVQDDSSQRRCVVRG